MNKLATLLALFITLGLLAGCASLRPDFEEPAVNVTSFRVIPSESAVPKFEIGLHVINPNRTALKLYGISYNVELEGHRVLTGVSNDLPVIAAYGEGDVLLRGSPDLFSTISLFVDMMNQPRELFKFNFEAKLDVGSFLPRIRVTKAGEVSLAGVKNK